MKQNNKFPIFLIGSARSGTTLLQRILNTIDNITIYGEHLGFLKYVSNAYFMNINLRTMNTTDKTFMKIRKKSSHHLYKSLKDPKIWSANLYWQEKKTIKKNYKKLIENLFYPPIKEEVHWGFKEIRYGCDDQVLEMLNDLYPKARFIFIIRNPHDTIKKQAIVGWWGHKKLTEKWIMQNRKIIEFLRKNKKKAFIVKYEDLVNDNKNTLKNLFDWLGINIKNKQYEVIKIKLGETDSYPYLSKFHYLASKINQARAKLQLILKNKQLIQIMQEVEEIKNKK